MKTDKKVDDVKSEILRFKNILADYQDIKLANVYEGLIKKLYYKELKIFGDSKRFNLSKTAAIMLFKFMRYKDEYEVARLHTKTKFSKEFLKKNKDSKIEYYLAPPMLSLKDKSGYPKKIKFGSWIIVLFKVLAKLKFLRSTKFDIFGKTSERKKERELSEKSKQTIKLLTDNLLESNYNLCEKLVETALKINGFGYVKEKKILEHENDWDIYLQKITKTDYKQVG